MSESELGKRLLQMGTSDARDSMDARHVTRMILDRDRRRIRLLGSVIVLLWLLGTGGIVFVLYKLAIHVPEYMRLQLEIEQGSIDLPLRQQIQEDYFWGFQIGMTLTVCSVAVLALAALGTFLLVLASRRATLRQVNANLLLISERLRKLQEHRQPTAGTPPPADERATDRPPLI